MSADRGWRRRSTRYLFESRWFRLRQDELTLPSGEDITYTQVEHDGYVVVVPLLGLSLFLGLYPKPVLDRIQPAVELRVQNLERKSDYRQPEPPAIAKEIQQIERDIRNDEADVQDEVGTGENGESTEAGE